MNREALESLDKEAPIRLLAQTRTISDTSGEIRRIRAKSRRKHEAAAADGDFLASLVEE